LKKAAILSLKKSPIKPLETALRKLMMMKSQQQEENQKKRLGQRRFSLRHTIKTGATRKYQRLETSLPGRQ